jgi:hypothetical protein
MSNPSAAVPSTIEGDATSPIGEDALDCLATTRASSFIAEPSTIQPFGGGSTLAWSVLVPVGCDVVVSLNGRVVNSTGRQSVAPASTTQYILTASQRGTRRVLASTTVRVDTSACLSVAVPESRIHADLDSTIRQVLEDHEELSQRADPRVEVDAKGIHMALRFALAIDNFSDPNIDVDFTLGLRVRNGAADPFYQKVAIDIDWPWWVTVLSSGMSERITEIVENVVEALLKPQILGKVKDLFGTQVEQLPPGLQLHALRLAPNEIVATACPPGPHMPFIVLPTVASHEAVG